MTRARKPKRPTHYQSGVLAQIARSRLIKTYSHDHTALWSLADGTPVPAPCALALIRNGWVVPQRDGLSMFEESQSYVALKP